MLPFDRSDRIISRKFFQFLLPTVLSTVATSLNEFVDSKLKTYKLDIVMKLLEGTDYVMSFNIDDN